MTKLHNPYRIAWIGALLAILVLASCQSVRKNQATFSRPPFQWKEGKDWRNLVYSGANAPEYTKFRPLGGGVLVHG